METHDYMEEGVFNCSIEWTYQVTGYYDAHLRWHGLVRIEKYMKRGDGKSELVYTEEVMMVHGKRDGLSTTTYQGGTVSYKVYNMGHEVEGAGGSKKASAISSFHILDAGFSWQKLMFNGSGFDDLFLQAYLDTFDLLLNNYEVGMEALDSIYGEVEDLLDDSRFDSLHRVNINFFSFINGMEELKNTEFRLSVIDQYRTGRETLFEVTENTYPNYLSSLEEQGVGRGEFEEFSTVFDSCMLSYGPVDTTDMLTFTDSVDTRIYRALTAIYSSGQAKSAAAALVDQVFREGKMEPLAKKSIPEGTTPPDVAEVIIYDLMYRYLEGNVFRKCILKAWAINHDIVLLPTVTTRVEDIPSATGVTITGHVLEDGGAAVTSRGIVWAAHYDPTTGDQMVSAGSGTGAFTADVEGLTEGKTYYARTFAINQAGVAYGNCISFTPSAAGPSGLQQVPEEDLRLFPNPASGAVHIATRPDWMKGSTLVIIQINGQVAHQENTESMVRTGNRLEVDLSGLDPGSYVVQLRKGKRILASRVLLVVH